MRNKVEEGSRASVQSILDKYPKVSLVQVCENLSEEEFRAQEKKQHEYPIYGAALAIILVRNDGIILTKRTGPHPGWALPSGRVEVGEGFDKAIIREGLEETGVIIEIDDLLTAENKIFQSPSGKKLGLVLMTFVSRVKSGTPHTTAEAEKEGLEVGVFSKNALPELMVESDRQKINEYFDTFPTSR